MKAQEKAGNNNTNFPKCTNCLLNLCNAGMVNHSTRKTGFRTECLFNCGCTEYKEYHEGDILKGE